MNELVARAYRNTRRENPTMPAATALAIAKRKEWPAWAQYLAQREYGDLLLQGRVNGKFITIRTEVECDPDFSFLGKFTDDPREAIDNPEYQHGRFRYFQPAWENVTPLETLRRTHSKAEALAIRAAEVEDMARAALREQYVITVEVEVVDDEVYGTATLGGCYIDDVADLLWCVDDHGMIDQAIADAGHSVDTSAA
jgi:hypothetical protein